MVKVSISLPNNAQITFESEESEVLREIVGMALRDLPRELMQSPASPSAEVTGGSTEKGTSVAATALSAATTTEPAPAATPDAPAARPTPSIARETDRPSASTESAPSEVREVPAEFLSASGRQGFEAFCRDANPLGDMRRVVVATEGASRHFGVDGVDADDLGWLFDAAGWRRPGNFTQTLRNAARSKFGWLERIPGRSGRYAATPLGLSKNLPSGG